MCRTFSQPITLQSSEDLLVRKAELCDELLVLLKEAGVRGSPQDACLVIAGVLDNLANYHDDVASLAAQWRPFIEPEPSALRLIKGDNHGSAHPEIIPRD